MSILECKKLVKNYKRFRALNGIDLIIEPGKIVGLLGPNGSGKTTLIKVACGLLTADEGQILIDGMAPSVETKKIVAYLPERSYLPNWMKVSEAVSMFADYYEDFSAEKAYSLISDLGIDADKKLAVLSKGTREKVQLILVMSRNAKLYLLDEPIAGVDPAARDYILKTIISNYNPEASVIISTHLIQDIEKVLDEIVFLSYGNIALHAGTDDIREKEGKSIDALFREVFRC